MSAIFKKWWVILIQGLLLIALGIYFIKNPFKVLTVISIWITVLIMIIGVIGIVGYFLIVNKEQRGGLLWWSLMTLLLGILMFTDIEITMKTITIMFGVWMLFTGVWLTRAGWELHQQHKLSWLMIIAGILSMAIAVTVIFDITSGAVWLSTFMALQAIIAGVGLVFFGLLKRRVVSRIKNTLLE